MPDLLALASGSVFIRNQELFILSFAGGEDGISLVVVPDVCVAAPVLLFEMQQPRFEPPVGWRDAPPGVSLS